MKNLFQRVRMTKKSDLLCGVVVAFVMFAFCACGGSSRMSKATSTRVDFAKTVRVIPSMANLSVWPTHVVATSTASELESLDLEQSKQAVVAKALATVKGDVMLAPQFYTEKGDDGKMKSLTVTGYAAMITSFRPMNESDVEVDETKIEEGKQEISRQKVALNTMTVADVEYSTKKSITLTSAELSGKNEASALKYAKEQLLRQEKMDVLYGEQYSISVDNGQITSFTLTAFPGKYVNYRKTSVHELLLLKPTTKPVVNYVTMAADIQPVASRVQLKFGTGNAQTSEADLKEVARSAALNKYKADFLLNETFYFDRQDKIITHVTICGTPAVYTNFRPLADGEVVDVKLAPISGDQVEEEKPKSLLDTILGLFKKKK